ncbi:MAG: hypothetical protein ACOX66_03700 [Oscillospiraceae bacterium]
MVQYYFLGGNTQTGFYSLYDSFVSQADGDFLWILKGGPGCGKSSFMKRIGAAAEKAGYDVEYVICSGDPSSLDGVYIPELHTAYMDGTAPHVADAHFPAADSAYLDLGVFYDIPAISQRRNELTGLYAECAACHAKAYAMLRAAGSVKTGWQGALTTEDERSSALLRAEGIAAREFGKRRRERGQLTRRFLSAISCFGPASFPETASALCDHFFVFDDRLLLGSLALQKLADCALEAGHDVLLCPDPLTPELPEAVLVPSLSLGFIVSSSELAQLDGTRRVRFDALVETERFRALKPELRQSEKLVSELKTAAMASLAKSKATHDLIEDIYNPHVDFDGVYALARKHINDLGLA